MFVPRLWVGVSLAAAVIAAAGSLVGLLAPAIIVFGLMTARGSVPAYLAWLGCLIFTAYNYAIYAFSIHFGPLFLPWVAVLGLSVYAAAASLSEANVASVKVWFGGRPMPVTAWTLIGFGVLFGVLWLSQIVPDLLAGRPSSTAQQWNVPTNPVHVLDLALFLPAVLGSGLLLLRRRALGYATATAELVFLALTCCPILVTPLIARIHGHAPDAAVVVPIGLVLLVTTVVLCRTVRRPSRI